MEEIPLLPFLKVPPLFKMIPLKSPEWPRFETFLEYPKPANANRQEIICNFF